MKKKVAFMVMTALLLILACAPAWADNTDSNEIELTLRGKLSFDITGDGEVALLKGYVLETPADLSQLGHYYIEVKAHPLNRIHTLGLPVAQIKDLTVIDKGEKRLVMEGKIVRDELEGGFYSLQGYRLAGDYEFADLEGRLVRVGGLPDHSPSIFMTRTIEVLELEKVNPAGPTQLRGVLREQVIPGGYGVIYCIGDYALIGPHELAEYKGVEVLVKGALSPGAPISGHPVYNVAAIEVLSRPETVKKIESGEGKSVQKENPAFIASPRRPGQRINVEYMGNTLKLNRVPVLQGDRLMIAAEDMRSFELHYEFTGPDAMYIQSNRNHRSLKIAVGMRAMSTPDGMVDMDNAPVTWDGSLWIPLRPVLEYLGYRVTWDKMEPVVCVE